MYLCAVRIVLRVFCDDRFFRSSDICVIKGPISDLIFLLYIFTSSCEANNDRIDNIALSNCRHPCLQTEYNGKYASCAPQQAEVESSPICTEDRDIYQGLMY